MSNELKQAEAVAWRNFDGEGNHDFTEDLETAERWMLHNGDKYKDWCQPLFLHAPPTTAKEDDVMADLCGNCNRLTYSPTGDAKWCCFCGAKLGGEVAKLNGVQS